MPGWDYNWNMHNGTGWLGALFMTITMILFWGGLITVVVLLQRRLGRPSTDNRDAASRILDERFARGEIDEAEYQRRQRTLRSIR